MSDPNLKVAEGSDRALTLDDMDNMYLSLEKVLALSALLSGFNPEYLNEGDLPVVGAIIRSEAERIKELLVRIDEDTEKSSDA